MTKEEIINEIKELLEDTSKDTLQKAGGLQFWADELIKIGKGESKDASYVIL